MTDQPSQRPDGTGPADSSPAYEPPRFVPPQGPSVPPPPPLYNQGQFGQFGQDRYSQPPLHNQDLYSQNSYQSQYSPGQAGAPYGQEQYGSSLYGQPGYGAQAQPKGLSIASMVCGIVAVLLGFIMVPQLAAIITGHLALKREPAGKALSITGLVLGYLCLLGYGVLWILLVVGMSLASTYGY